MSSRSETLRWLSFLTPFLLLVLFASTKVASQGLYQVLVAEDGPVENLQFLLFFVSGILAGVTAVRLARAGLAVHRWLYWLLAIALVVVAMDEISWGQRLLGIKTPESLQAVNLQDELTIHNLRPVMIYLHVAYLLVGAYGAFAWLPRMLLVKTPCSIWRFVIPEWYVSSWFGFLFLVYGLIELAQWVQPTLFGHHLVIGHFITFRDQEPAELALAAGMFIFVMVNLRRASDLCRHRESV
ncbi:MULTISPECIES: hypothetical protein [unclassified Wenzhouxiangella]|uniref:hypothetical protein n=1 Tax=unclassified Wenzhouxiangella TaxID=2613841 RepID=UPI000E3A8BCD|nr:MULTISPECIES: hypothetical protein [unclassified Wenzhouxiangella]RFF27713.1 hypothetical protein DZK25_06785 [Wenzhouxiangella sp. 15181]